jgi:hypothetical protein
LVVYDKRVDLIPHLYRHSVPQRILGWIIGSQSEAYLRSGNTRDKYHEGGSHAQMTGYLQRQGPPPSPATGMAPLN